MKNIFILAFLFCGQFVSAAKNSQCTDKWVPIKIKRFSGFTEASLSKEVQIAKLVTPSPDQQSTYEKSFEMGKYRFVRNDKNWDIYRKNEKGGFELKRRSGQFSIDTDQNIYAQVMPTGEINIRKTTVGYGNEFNVFFTPTEISLKNSEGQSIFQHPCVEIKKIIANPIKNSSAPAGTKK